MVTGAAGFIGSHLVERLRADGKEVVGFDNYLTGRHDNVTDILNRDISNGFFDRSAYDYTDVETIYHCAASYNDPMAWDLDTKTNVLGSINVARLAGRIGAKVVYFQTSLCYGRAPVSPVRTDSPLAPRGSYAVRKTAGEQYLIDSGVPLVSLRLANMYGPRNLSGPIPAFYRRLRDGQYCTVVDTRRDFLFIDDLVDLVMKLGDATGIFHVATGTDRSIKEVYDTVAEIMGIDAAPVLQPRGEDDVATILLDPTETQKRFDWQATTPLSTGIHKAVEWYRSHGVDAVYTHLEVRS
jgi:UDP-glucose 4-epimerase